MILYAEDAAVFAMICLMIDKLGMQGVPKPLLRGRQYSPKARAQVATASFTPKHIDVRLRHMVTPVISLS